MTHNDVTMQLLQGNEGEEVHLEAFVLELASK